MTTARMARLLSISIQTASKETELCPSLLIALMNGLDLITKWKIVQGCKEKYAANYILKFIAKRLTFLGSASLPREIRAYFTGAEPKEKNVRVCPCESVANP
jgi:hypothetical protein